MSASATPIVDRSLSTHLAPLGVLVSITIFGSSVRSPGRVNTLALNVRDMHVVRLRSVLSATRSCRVSASGGMRPAVVTHGRAHLDVGIGEKLLTAPFLSCRVFSGWSRQAASVSSDSNSTIETPSPSSEVKFL